MGFVTLNHVTALAKTLVKDADNMDRNIWKEWICMFALPELGASDDDIDVAELTPNNLLAPLPPNMRSLLELSLFDAGGNQLSHKFRTGRKRIFSDRRLSQTAIGTDSTSLNDLVPVDVSNDAYNIVLGTNGANVAKIFVRYFKWPFDENNEPLIKQEDALACALCIKWLQALRDNDNQAQISNYERSWQIKADQAKALKKTNMMHPERAKTVLKDMLRLIPSFDHSQF